MAITPAQFHILLTLTEGDCHGYGIMQEIQRRTDGAVELGPGTLYRSIKQLLSRGFIVEVGPAVEIDSDPGKPRRSYALTPSGELRLREEAQRLRSLVAWADSALVLKGRRA